MADFTDRIRLVVETVADKATADIKNVSKGISETEGAFGKLKAGASGVGDVLKNNMGLSVAAAGTAVAGFVTDAIGKFQDLALAAGDVAAATGLTVEQASRWMEVSGDLGVSTEALQSAVGRLNRAAGEGKLAKLGIDAENANDRLLNTLAYINSIPNSADRAKAGVDLLGKGWQSLAPLVEKSGELKQALADVGSGQVISEDELAKAREFRDVMDELSDRWQGFVITVGGGAADLLTDFAKITAGAGNIIDKLNSAKAPGGIGGITDFVGDIVKAGAPLYETVKAFGQISDSSLSATDRVKGVGRAFLGIVPVLGNYVGAHFLAADSAKKNAEATTEMASAAEIARGAAEAEATAHEELEKAITAATNAALAAFNAQLAYEDAQTKTTEAVDKANVAQLAAAVAGGTNAEANQKAAAAMNDAEKAALSEASASLKLAQDTATTEGYTLSAAQSNAILAANLRATASTMDPNNPLRKNLEAYANKLDAIPETVSTDVNADTSAANAKIDALIAKLRGLDTEIFTGGGGIQSAPKGVPSYVLPASTNGAQARSAAAFGSLVPSVVPMASGGGGRTYVVNVYVPPSPNLAEFGRLVTDAIDAFERRTGSRRRVA